MNVTKGVAAAAAGMLLSLAGVSVAQAAEVDLNQAAESVVLPARPQVYKPVTIVANVGQTDADQLRYLWYMPPGAILVSQDDNTAVVRFNEDGEQIVHVLIVGASTAGAVAAVHVNVHRGNVQPLPSLFMTGSPSPGNSAAFTIFDALGDDLDLSGPGMRVSWNFGDGPWQEMTAPSAAYSSISTSKTFSQAQDYDVLANITDPVGATNWTSMIAHAGATTASDAPRSANTVAGSPPVSFAFRGIGGFGFPDEYAVQPRLGVPMIMDARTFVDAPAGAVDAHWDFGDGTVAEGLTVAKTFTTPGAINMRVDVEDANGNHDVETSTYEAIPYNRGPVVGYVDGAGLHASGTPVTPAVGINASDPDAQWWFSADHHYGIESATWNFGDGSPPVTGWCPSHVYATPGDYDLTVTVADADGAKASTTRTVFVRNGATSTPTATHDVCQTPTDPPPTAGGGGAPAGGGGGGGGGGAAKTGASSAPAAGAEVAPPPAPAPTPTAVAPVTTEKPTAPVLTRTQILGALGGMLAQTPTFKELTSDGAVRQTFVAPGPGRLRVVWLATPRRGAKPRTVASAGVRVDGVRRVSVRVALTKAARRQLAAAGILRVQMVATFTPDHGITRSSGRRVTITRQPH